MDGSRRTLAHSPGGSSLPGRLAIAALMLIGGIAVEARAEVGYATIGGCPPKPCPHSGGADQVSRLARESYGSNYSGHYIGGGSAFSLGSGRFQNEHRCFDEGTFGMDYNPCWSRVGLLWSHGRRHQSGHGQYDTDKKNCGFPNWLR